MNSQGAIARTGGRDLAAELDEDDGAFPESWKPRPGDKIVGTVTKYTTGEGKFGPKPICVLNVLNDVGVEFLLSVWISHAVLLSEFQKQRPKIGERIGIKRLEDSPKGYAMYRLKVDREEKPEPDWDALGEPTPLDTIRAGAGAAAADDESDIPF